MDNIHEILNGCLRKDRQSQEKLYRLFYPGMFALCKCFFEDEHDCLTALNNGMLIVFNKIDQYDASKGQLFNWAYSVVRNAAITYLNKKKQNRLHIELADSMPDKPGQSPFKQLEWKDIYLFLSKLPSTTRAVCTLYYLEGYFIKEVAVLLELKEGTVKWHLNECRGRLKILLTTKPVSQSA